MFNEYLLFLKKNYKTMSGCYMTISNGLPLPFSFHQLPQSRSERNIPSFYLGCIDDILPV